MHLNDTDPVTDLWFIRPSCILSRPGPNPSIMSFLQKWKSFMILDEAAAHNIDTALLTDGSDVNAYYGRQDIAGAICS